MTAPPSLARDVRSSIAAGRISVGGPAQYLGSFPAAEPGLTDPYLSDYLAAGRMLGEARLQALGIIETLAYRGSPLSMLFVADALRKGDDYEMDLEKSEGWYRHAASLGSGRAMYGLGLVHLARDEIESAVEAFKVAGERGCGAGMWALGLLYKDGRGLSPDIDQARAWLERGAALGHVWSSRSVSILLMSGRYGFWARLRGYAMYAACFIAAPMAVFGGKIDRLLR